MADCSRGENARLQSCSLSELTETAGKQEKALQENLATIKIAFDSGDLTVVDLTAAEAALDKARSTVLGTGSSLSRKDSPSTIRLVFLPGIFSSIPA